MDANNGIVPLVIAVYEIENTETWTWFLEILHSYFDNGSYQITFCSDRQKGLLGAIENTWPTAFHRSYARHIYSNFSKDHPGVTLRNLFWRAVSSTNKFDHVAAMEKLKKEKRKEAQSWSNIPPRVKNELDDAYETGSKMTAMASDKSYYPARRFIVDLMSRSCDCGHWELSELPCAHDMAAISHARHDKRVPAKILHETSIFNTYVVMFKSIPNKGLSGPGESSNAETTSKRRKRMVVSSPDERFTHSRGRGGNKGRGSRIRGGRYEVVNLSLNPTQGSQVSQIIDG
ncbi:hypothetical protein WN943_018316 [Citrus x changshan-huyou]